MKDVQSLPDDRGVSLQQVGVKDVYLPFSVLVKDNGCQEVLGRVSLSVDLPEDRRATHMSRFMAILYEWSKREISSREIKTILEVTAEKLQARSAELNLFFRYFISKKAPVSGQECLLDYFCSFKGVLQDSRYSFLLGVQVPILTLCPCSKEISRFGAHNQRGYLKVTIQYLVDSFIWIEELVKSLEELGSCEIFPLLKREDEQFVTERAYENPKFVEDVLRDAVLLLRNDKRITYFDVECVAFESIHSHSAFAFHREGKIKNW